MSHTHMLMVDVDCRVSLPKEIGDPLSFSTEVLQAASQLLSISGEVSVSFVSNEDIHELNRIYRNVDRPTDVLSFSMVEGEEVFPGMEGELEPLGDIVVSVPQALQQAKEYGHGIRREMGFLLVHGFLHLIGYDHQDEASEQEMFGLQEKVLTQLGMKRVQ